MPRYKRITLLLICCLLGRIAFAQSPSLDERAFGAMSDAERYRFVHDFSFAKMDSATAHAVLNRMQDIAQQKKDCRTVLAVKYRVYTVPLNPQGTSRGWNIMFDALKEMEWRAKECGFEVEEIAGRFYAVYENFNYERIPHERLYAEIHKTIEQMERMGVERFSDYQPEAILYRSIQYMWNLEDYEEAYRYLSLAERVIQPTPENRIFFTLVLNHLQSYWQEQKKDYPKAIEYAQKIRQYYLRFQDKDPKQAWKSRFWQGFPLLSIAEMRLAQGDTTGVEASADAGYALTKRAEDNTDIFAYLAEYEALQVYVPIKLTFGKLDEAGRLLQHAANIKERMGVRWEVDVFKHIKFYKNYARYHDLSGNHAEALRYTQDASVLQDSLNKRNDIRKYERIKQRLEIEKYASKLQLIESEKELQKLLRNAAFVILFLVSLLMYAWFHRQQYLRRQKEAELEAARNDLASMTNSFLEKAELVENLRLEMSKISAGGAHSQYLEQLTGSTILMEGDWQRFRSVFEKVYPEFIAEQKALYPGLTPGELRYLVLEKLQLSTREMARMLGVSDNTVRQKRARLRRKGNPSPSPSPNP
jgi:hypothetical protein